MNIGSQELTIVLAILAIVLMVPSTIADSWNVLERLWELWKRMRNRK